MYLREILESEYGNKPVNEVAGAVVGGLSKIFQPLAKNLGWLYRSEAVGETLFATISEGWNPFDEIYQWQQGNITNGEALVGIRNFLGTISFIFAAIRGIKLLENIWKNLICIKSFPNLFGKICICIFFTKNTKYYIQLTMIEFESKTPDFTGFFY